ncbi:MAG TPA: enoyl-CoA hydratase-related protein [Kofleriaceae bacterium]|nr:enoyl-CoA hydratase-related protein [Kofleriaceae bacterium]
MSDHVKITKSDGILTLILDRPEKKNALTDAMYGALADAIDDARTDDEVRVILLRSEGSMFTSGNDVGEFAAVAMGGSPPQHVGRFLRAITMAAKPLVAAVQGRAIGVGTTMLLHFDHVVLADNAELSTPFVNLALVPEASSSLLLPARIGHLRAFAMFALGEPVAAQEALSWGLANKVVPLAELVPTAEAFAARLAAKPAGALVATKQLMRDTAAVAAQMDLETEQFVERLKSAEAREAFMAFAARRPRGLRAGDAQRADET